MTMSRTLLLLVLVPVPGFGQQATDRPARELLVAAGHVAVVEPVDPRQPARMRVVGVVRGDKLKVGDGLDCPTLAAAADAEGGPGWANLRQGVVFGEVGEPFRLLPTGARLTTGAGKCWVAESRPAGGFRLVPQPKLDWDALLAQLKQDAGDLAALEAIRQQPPGTPRSRALIAWMRRHPPVRPAPVLPSPLVGPDGPVEDVGDTSWGELETAPLRWVLQTGVAEDSWDALAVYAQQHGGALAGRDCHPFATPAGRALLLAKLKAEGGLDGDALRALRLLGWAETYPTAAVPAAPFAKPMTPDEQQAVAEAVRPLLAKGDNRWKQAAAHALVAVVRGAEKTPDGLRKDLADGLDEALKASKPGTTRNVLAEARFRVAPDGRGPVALLLDLGRRDAKLYFWLAVLPDATVPEAPTLLLEEVAADGKATEVLKEAVTSPTAIDWTAGWETRRPLYVEVPIKKLKVGPTYRLTVSGVVGPGKVPFTSEPRTFQAAGPMMPNQAWSPSTGRIVFDEE